MRRICRSSAAEIGFPHRESTASGESRGQESCGSGEPVAKAELIANVACRTARPHASRHWRCWRSFPAMAWIRDEHAVSRLPSFSRICAALRPHTFRPVEAMAAVMVADATMRPDAPDRTASPLSSFVRASALVVESTPSQNRSNDSRNCPVKRSRTIGSRLPNVESRKRRVFQQASGMSSDRRPESAVTRKHSPGVNGESGSRGAGAAMGMPDEARVKVTAAAEATAACCCSVPSRRVLISRTSMCGAEW